MPESPPPRQPNYDEELTPGVRGTITELRESVHRAEAERLELLQVLREASRAHDQRQQQAEKERRSLYDALENSRASQERAASEADNQRQILFNRIAALEDTLLQQQNQFSSQLGAELATAASQRTIMMDAITRAAGTASNPIPVSSRGSVSSFQSIGATTTDSSLARPVTTLNKDDEERKPIFSSARAALGAYDFISVDQCGVLRRLPTYAWPKASKHHSRLQPPLLAVVTEFAEAATDPREYLRALPTALRQAGTAGRTLNVTDACMLQSISAALEEGGGLQPSLLVALAEIGALKMIQYEAIAMLRLTRTSRPAVDDNEFAAWVSGKTSCGGGLHLGMVQVRNF